MLLASCLLLAGCSKGGAGAATAEAGSTEADNHVPCALADARSFVPDCTIEIARRDGAEIWVVRHPDGGFRRFQIIDNGTRIATADGMQEVEASRAGGNLEVRVGADRYLFPAAPEPVASESRASTR